MQVRVLEKGNDFLRLELPQGEETLLIPLVEALQGDESVVEARYYLGHPLIEAPVLYLKTSGEKPQTVLKKTLKELSDTYGDALADFDRKTKKAHA